MDSFIFQNDSYSNLQNLKFEENDYIIVPSKKIHFRNQFCYQNWALPDSLIYNITMNPKTPKVYQKLIKCCKYFYAKNPILVIADVCTEYYKSYKNKWQTAFCEAYLYDKNSKCKVWITVIFSAGSENSEKQSLVSSIIPKLFKCDVAELNLKNQNISFQEFLFLSSSVKSIYFQECSVKYENGLIVPFEKLVQSLPKVENIEFRSNPFRSEVLLECMTSKTFTELLKIPHFFGIQNISLQDVPDVVDINSFYLYMKKNKRTAFCLCFSQTISLSNENQIRLKEIVNEIITTNNHDYRPPYIYFNEMGTEECYKLDNIFSEFQNSY